MKYDLEIKERNIIMLWKGHGHYHIGVLFYFCISVKSNVILVLWYESVAAVKLDICILQEAKFLCTNLREQSKIDLPQVWWYLLAHVNLFMFWQISLCGQKFVSKCPQWHCLVFTSFAVL